MDKERQEKKFTKAEKEKKTKEEVLKSRSILTNFFGKARTIDCASSLGSTAVAGPSSSQSDFGKTFKPFVLKKDTDLAPINWFISAKRRSAVGRTDVIVIDDEEDTKAKGIDTEDVQQAKVDVGSMDARGMAYFGSLSFHQVNRHHVGRLYSILSCLPHSADLQVASQSLPSPASGEMTNGLTVRGIIAHLTEAEIAGDVSLVRALLSKLRNRKLVPAKVLIFAEDARPGYFGTWTRASDVIGPRKPFSKDPVVLDYAYDSGEEWEEEGMGEADDVVEDEEDEPDDVESDSDSWLDDDAAPDDGTLLGSRPTSPSILPPAPGQKRKSVDSDQILGKKRKVIAPLAPFARGPYWESTIGRCEYDPFKPYRIHIFNGDGRVRLLSIEVYTFVIDTPFPIDPFTFVADSVQECRLSTRDNPPSDVVFLMPSLPERLSVVKSNTTPAPGLPSSAPAPNRRTPKTSFPDAHLPLLLAKISSLATGSIAFLVESIYQDLSGQNVKKNAIEAKVKEVGERCRDKKIWVVKSGVVS
jgi:chromatin assembly factor 1 subunit A